jgi:tetratricopeptide (TPR) repeat protein
VSRAAAHQYATGIKDGANTTTPASFQPALKAFTLAIDDRPDYAQAYDRRAEVEEAIGSPGPISDYTDVVSKGWLIKAVNDEATAYGLGLRDVDELSDFGTDSFDLWVSAERGGGFPSTALTADQQLTTIDATNPIGWTELGLADLVNGQFTSARAAFTRAIENILYSNVEHRTLRPAHSHNDQAGWVQNAMTQLDQLANSTTARGDPSLRTAALENEGFFAASLPAGRVVEPSRLPTPYHQGSTSFDLTPGSLGAHLPAPAAWDPTKGGRDLAKGNVLTLWYTRHLEHGKGTGPWSAITNSVHWSSDEPDSALGDPSNCDTMDAYCAGEHLLENANLCLSNAQYRFDVFYDGVRVISQAASPTTDFGDPVARTDEQMNLGTCIPSTWRYQASLRASAPVVGTSNENSHSLSDFMMSYIAPGGKYGFDILRIYPSRDDFTGNLTDLVESISEWSIEELVNGRILPPDTAPFGTPVTNGVVFLNDGTDMVFRSPSTDIDVITRAGITNDNAVVVTVEYGPRAWFATNTAINLLFSATLLDYG